MTEPHLFMRRAMKTPFVPEKRTRFRIVLELSIDNDDEKLITYLHHTQQGLVGQILSSFPLPVGSYEMLVGELGAPLTGMRTVIGKTGHITQHAADAG
jgi:hypothetical protein